MESNLSKSWNSHTNIIGVNFTSERSEAVPSCRKCCSSNTTHVVESINLLQQNLRLVKHNTTPHCVWQVPGGELEVSINTNMLQVADGAIQQRTDINKSVQAIQLGESDYIINANGSFIKPVRSCLDLCSLHLSPCRSCSPDTTHTHSHPPDIQSNYRQINHHKKCTQQVHSPHLSAALHWKMVRALLVVSKGISTRELTKLKLTTKTEYTLMWLRHFCHIYWIECHHRLCLHSWCHRCRLCQESPPLQEQVCWIFPCCRQNDKSKSRSQV